jgi:hypothetical protein
MKPPVSPTMPRYHWHEHGRLKERILREWQVEGTHFARMAGRKPSVVILDFELHASVASR